MLTFYNTSAVVQIGTTPLTYAPASPRERVLLFFYNSAVAARTLTIAVVGDHTVQMDIQPGTAETMMVELAGALTVSASGTGVSACKASR